MTGKQSSIVLAAAMVTTAHASDAPQKFRAKGRPVVPAPDGTIFCEAEESATECKKLHHLAVEAVQPLRSRPTASASAVSRGGVHAGEAE
jgi:hypothetical protein